MNGFDILRLAAAVLVIFHHGFVLNGRASPLLGYIDMGALAVGAFFVISGYLVTGSFQRSANAGAYLAKRVLRIAPGLIVSLILTALVLGAMVSTFGAAEYFSRPETYLYVLRNTLLYPVTYDLPGVFRDAPYPDIVNGSLWTLRLEFTCYLGVAVLGLARMLNRPLVLGLTAAAAVAFLGLSFVQDGGNVARMAHVGALNGFLFLAGAAFQLDGRRPGRWLTILSIVLLTTPWWVLGLPVVVMVLGRLRAAPKLPADLSYGLYIYAFPLQQVLASMGMLSFPAALAATLPFAAMSWWLVEKPTLKLKARVPS